MVKTTGWIFSHFRKLEVQDQDASIGEGPPSSLQTPSSCVLTWQSDFSDICSHEGPSWSSTYHPRATSASTIPKNSVDTNIQSVPPPPISGSLTSQMEGFAYQAVSQGDQEDQMRGTGVLQITTHTTLHYT